MPSEEKRQLAQDAIRERSEAFLSALSGTAEQVRGLLGQAEAGGDTRVAAERAALGHFGAEAINADAFAALCDEEQHIDPKGRSAIEAAQKTLHELLDQENGLFALTLKDGTTLGCGVGQKLAQLGRAFGAARVVELAKSGSYDEAKHAGFLKSYPFSKWGPAERAVAPPLVVECVGQELRAATLASYLDGGIKIVLVVDGDAPPAALVRLVTPSVFVQQSTDETTLEGFASFDGVAVAALLPASVVKFVHDPRAGKTAHERFATLEIPELSQLVALGGISAAQQREDLGLLDTLSAKPAEADSAKPDPAGRLSAWLLSQADISNLSA